MTDSWRTRFWVWILFVIGLTTSPWDQIVTHPHFDKIHWIPFKGSPFLLSDIIGNILLFIPLGVSYVFSSVDHGKRPTLIIVLAISACLSLCIECSQIFIHTRTPSTMDWLCNTTGGMIGGLIAVIWSQSRLKQKEV